MVSPEIEKQYNAFIVNRALSYHQDSILLVNEMNVACMLDGKMQYDFLRSTLRPRKRFSKWAKPNITDKLKVIKDYYGYNNEKAMAVESIFTDEDIERMKKKMNKGGRI